MSFQGRHLFGLGAVHATFTISSGLLQAADPVTASTAEVTVDASSFRSNLDRYAFGVTRGKGIAGRFLDLDLDAVAGPA